MAEGGDVPNFICDVTEVEVGKNFHILVETLTDEAPETWESIATLIDEFERFETQEYDLKKIIQIGEVTLQNEELEEKIYFFVLFCLCFAFKNIKKPYSYCIGTPILPLLCSMIDDSTGPMLIRICTIIRIFCEDVTVSKSYGENSLALQCALRPLVFASTQLDLTTQSMLIIECLMTTKEIFALGDTTKDDCSLLFEIYSAFASDDTDINVLCCAYRCLAFFINRKKEYVNSFSEKQLAEFVEAIKTDNQDITVNVSSIIAAICTDDRLLGYFIENQLPDIIFDRITMYAGMKKVPAVRALMDCFLTVCDKDESLIPFFFQHELFIGRCLVDLSTQVNNYILELARMSLDLDEEPSFLADIEQISHVIEVGIDTDDDEALDDALTLLRMLIEHDAEIPDFSGQLEELSEHTNPQVSKDAAEILELLQSKEK